MLFKNFVEVCFFNHSVTAGCLSYLADSNLSFACNFVKLTGNILYVCVFYSHVTVATAFWQFMQKWKCYVMWHHVHTQSASRSGQKTMPVPHQSVFYRLDALPAAQPTVSKHWRHFTGSLHITWHHVLLSKVHTTYYLTLMAIMHVSYCCLQCFDAVGWVAGRASGL